MNPSSCFVFSFPKFIYLFVFTLFYCRGYVHWQYYWKKRKKRRGSFEVSEKIICVIESV